MKTKYILFFALIFSFNLNAQTKLCEEESFHPVDYELVKLRNRLQSKGVDSILIYRHWIHTNGYNGYGKIIWNIGGETFQQKFSCKDKVTSSEVVRLEHDTFINFYFQNKVDTISSNPDKPDINISHDASHFISFYHDSKNYCFFISGLEVEFNQTNDRAKWVKMLSDEAVCIIRNSRVNNLESD